jgi:hypothetical protein
MSSANSFEYILWHIGIYGSGLDRVIERMEEGSRSGSDSSAKMLKVMQSSLTLRYRNTLSEMTKYIFRFGQNIEHLYFEPTEGFAR